MKQEHLPGILFHLPVPFLAPPDSTILRWVLRDTKRVGAPGQCVSTGGRDTEALETLPEYWGHHDYVRFPGCHVSPPLTLTLFHSPG